MGEVAVPGFHNQCISTPPAPLPDFFVPRATLLLLLLVPQATVLQARVMAFPHDLLARGVWDLMAYA